MADLTIFQLPEQTGKTNDDVLAIVDSGDTTTSKIKVSTLLSGVNYETLWDSGSVEGAVTGYAVTGTTFPSNNYNTTYNQLIYGWNNLGSPNGDRTIFGFDNTISGAFSHICVGNGNTQICDDQAIAIGNSNSVNRMSVVGCENTFGGNNERGFVFGDENDGSPNEKTVTFGYNNTNTTANGVVIGSDNVSTANYGIVIGTFSSASGGNSISIGGDNDITSTGNYNVIIGGVANRITGTTSGSTIMTLSGYTATENDTLYLKHLKSIGQISGGFYDIGTGTTATTINFNNGNNQSLALTGNTDLTFTNAKVGSIYNLLVSSDQSWDIMSISATGYTIKTLIQETATTDFIKLAGGAQGDMIRIVVFDGYIVVSQQNTLVTYQYNP